MKLLNEKLLYVPSPQPDLLGTPESFGDFRADSDTLISELYEPLRQKYPDYISRRMIGYDTSGQYQMWMYDFCPEHYQACVYLQSGVHPIETEGYFGLARLMTLICEGEFPILREQVHFIVVPAVSVYGIHAKSRASNIIRNYDIPHNALGINSNRDCYEKRLAETRNVLKLVEEFREELTCGFDLHTTTTESWGDYLTVYPDTLPTREIVVALNDHLRRKNITWRTPTLVYCGNTTDYPTGSNASSYAAYFTAELGVPTCTLEHSDLIFDWTLGTSAALTRAVELYANHILQALSFFRPTLFQP